MGRARSWTVSSSMGWGRDRGVGEKRKQLSVKNLCSKMKFKREGRKSYQTYSFASYILSLENLLAVAQTCLSVFCLHILFMLFLTEISSSVSACLNLFHQALSKCVGLYEAFFLTPEYRISNIHKMKR